MSFTFQNPFKRIVEVGWGGGIYVYIYVQGRGDFADGTPSPFITIDGTGTPPLKLNIGLPPDGFYYPTNPPDPSQPPNPPTVPWPPFIEYPITGAMLGAYLAWGPAMDAEHEAGGPPTFNIFSNGVFVNVSKISTEFLSGSKVVTIRFNDPTGPYFRQNFFQAQLISGTNVELRGDNSLDTDNAEILADDSRSWDASDGADEGEVNTPSSVVVVDFENNTLAVSAGS